ncbi:MAG TPA: hypothetical protein VLN08_10345 [Vicinamibacterales bacterium]|nr:hypothetical protein [Vicinamibacterales bacterium]
MAFERSPTPGVVQAAFWRTSAAVAVAAAILALHASVAAQSHESAAQLLGQRFGFTPDQLAAVDAGTPVAVVLPSNVDHEIAVAGAVFVRATAGRLASLLQDVEQLETGKGYIRTRKLRNPPRLGDFAGFQLPAADVEALRDCRPGRCDVKLGQDGFDLFAKNDWSAPAAAARVNARARQWSLDYVVAYRKGGNRNLAVYLDSDKPQSVAREFEEMTGRPDAWPDALTPLATYFRGYPEAARPRRTSDFFDWSLAEFGLKPVFRINHVVVHGTGRTSGLRHVVAVKQLYASHYFHTAFEVRAVVSDGRPSSKGVYLVMLNMARSDGLTGVLGRLIIKPKAIRGSRGGLERALAAIKRMAEAGP